MIAYWIVIRINKYRGISSSSTLSWVGMIISIIGSFFTIGLFSEVGSISSIRFDISLLAAFIGAVSYGIYTAFIKEFSPKSKTGNCMPPFYCFFGMIIFALLLHIIYYVVSGFTTILYFGKLSMNDWIIIIFYAIVNFTIGYFMWFRINKNLSAETVIPLAYCTPFASALFVSVANTIPITPNIAIGLLLIITGIFIINRKHVTTINGIPMAIIIFTLIVALIPTNIIILDSQIIISLQVLTAIYAFYYGFLVYRTSENCKEMAINIGEILVNRAYIIEICKFSEYSSSVNNSITELDKYISTEKYNSIEGYIAITDIISTIYKEISLKNVTIATIVDDKLKPYIRAYENANSGILISEWLVSIGVSVLVSCIILLLRDGSILSNIVSILIATSLTLCNLILFDYHKKKERVKQLVSP